MNSDKDGSIQAYTSAEDYQFDERVRIKINLKGNMKEFLSPCLPHISPYSLTTSVRDNTKTFLLSLSEKDEAKERNIKTSLEKRQGSSQGNRARLSRLRFVTQ